MRNIFIPLTCLLLLSCGKSTMENTNSSTATDSIEAESEISYDKLFLLETYLTNEAVSDAELEKVDSTCAIFIFPTEEQLENIRKTEGEDNFDTILDDGNFYQATAMSLIDSLGIKTMTAKGRYLRLTGPTSWTLDVRKKSLPEWNLILFKKDKAPIVLPTAGLGPEKIQDYFDLSK